VWSFDGHRFRNRRSNPLDEVGAKLGYGSSSCKEPAEEVGDWAGDTQGGEPKTPLEVWHNTVKVADWANPAGVKQTFGDASILESGRGVFNISGNRFRLVVRINYAYRVVYVRFVGTHQEYDYIDMETV
jgi:mRNA interferase HigB